MEQNSIRTRSLPRLSLLQLHGIAFSVLFAGPLHAQVSNYAFQRSQGTYTPITGGTVLVAGNFQNEAFLVDLPSPFWFDGNSYLQMYVSCNGYVTFGEAPAPTNYAPLSSNAGYAGAISPFGTNLWDANLPGSEVRWERLGNEVVVQWQGVRRDVPSNLESFDVQVRLDLTNGLIHFVYGSISNLALSQSRFPQVGLRGPSNLFPTHVNNRKVDGTCWWGNSYPGSSNLDVCRFTRKAPARMPSAGLTFSFAWSSAVQLELETDGNGFETSWDIAPAAGGPPVCSGTDYPANTTFTLPCILSPGSYNLVVYDAQGDGLCCTNGSGGYVLSNLFNERIIDNRDDGAFSFTSSAPLPFDLPLGHDHLIDSLCNKEDYFTGDDVQATPDADVRAQYGIGQQTDDGYQFWFFNPDGGYSRRLFVSHATASYMFLPGPDKCSWLRLGYILTNPLPLNVLLNLRIRSRVNNVNRPWGAACRIRIDLPDLCPVVELIDNPSSPSHSCGLTGVLLNGSRFLYATFIPTAHKYKFQFERPGYLRNITSNSSSLLLTVWGNYPLEYGNKSYQVRASTSYDNGATWCPFGPACTITTAAFPPGTEQRMEAFSPAPAEAEATVWPNPCHASPISFDVRGLPAGTDQLHVELTDLHGRTLLQTNSTISDGRATGRIETAPLWSKGIHLLHFTAGTVRRTERIVIE